MNENVPKLSALPKKFSDWEVGSNYDLIKQMDSGSYGYTVEAIQKSTGKKVAIKRYNNIFEDLVDCKRILREITLFRKLQHPNLVSILEIIQPTNLELFDTIYVVMDYCQSDIKKLLKSPIHLQNVHIQTIVYNILSGLKYLHSAEIIHRNLKPGDILLNEDCSIKITDFELARSSGAEGIEGAYIYDKKDEDELDKEDYLKAMKPKIGSLLTIIEEQRPSKKFNSLLNANEDEDEDDEEKEKEKVNEDRKKTLAAAPKNKLLCKGKLQRSGKLNAKNIKRELTGHVVTKWYAAPENIILEKDYTASIDVWSLGCIFAELQGMLKINADTFMDRTPIFPGTSNFPLESDRMMIKRNVLPHSHTDQIYVIFTILGTPAEDDLSFVTEPKVIEYLKSFLPRKKVDFKEIYPGSSNEALDFISKTVVFNPMKRISIDECISHPYLSRLRDPMKEIIAEGPIKMAFEKEGELSSKRLRELFIEEIKIYKKT